LVLLVIPPPLCRSKCHSSFFENQWVECTCTIIEWDEHSLQRAILAVAVVVEDELHLH
jgi:hypothetical protein